MEIKKYLKPYIECTKVKTEYALLAGSAGGGTHSPSPAKTNPFDYEFDYEDDQDENENGEN